MKPSGLTYKNGLYTRIFLILYIIFVFDIDFAKSQNIQETSLMCNLNQETPIEISPTRRVFPTISINESFLIKFDDNLRIITFIRDSSTIIERVNSQESVWNEGLYFRGRRRFTYGTVIYDGQINRLTGTIHINEFHYNPQSNELSFNFQKRGICSLYNRRF